jgi:hypothetical protein
MSNDSASSHDDAVQEHLDRLLNSRANPKTICPSEVARALSRSDLEHYDAREWRNLMPLIRERVWELRDKGRVEVLQKGEVLSDNVALEDIKGPIRVRLKR